MLINKNEKYMTVITKEYVNRYSLGKRIDASVFFEIYDEKHYANKMIIDERGYFTDFPGITEDEELKIQKYLKSGSTYPYIEYESRFLRLKDGGFRFLWQIQPEGRYWEDGDGYGGTSDEEINLYCDLNCYGDWEGTFKLYSRANELLIDDEIKDKEYPELKVLFLGQWNRGKTSFEKVFKNAYEKEKGDLDEENV